MIQIKLLDRAKGKGFNKMAGREYESKIAEEIEHFLNSQRISNKVRIK